MIKTVIKRIVCVILFLLLLNLSIRAVSAFLDKPDVDEKYKQFFAEDDNMDVIFMGTSHTYNVLMPQELWNKWRIPSYNWGQSNNTVALSYHLLQLVCDYTSPTLVVMDLYGISDFAKIGNGKYKADSRDYQRIQFDPFPLSSKKIEAVNDIFDDYENRSDFFFKLAIYHNRWTEIKKDNFSPRNIPQKGAAFVLGVKETDYVERESKTECEIPDISKEYLEKMMDYCSEKGIRLLFTYLPFAATEHNIDVAASLEKYFAQYPEVEYVDMLRTGIINYKTDIYLDRSHLNYMGSVAVTDWMGEYISTNYPDTVHADDPDYADWNEDYDEYVDYKISRFVDGELYNNLQLLCGDDFMGEITVSTNGKKRFDSDTRTQNLIERLGDSVKVEYSEESSDGDMTLKVIDNRSGEYVFESVIKIPQQ